eukprot:scaffold55414_cov46-Phaeocystis_antarctica.AAC.1
MELHSSRSTSIGHGHGRYVPALEQIGLASRAHDEAVRIVLYRDILAEARGVVVTDGLGVTEGLEHRRGLAQQHLCTCTRA